MRKVLSGAIAIAVVAGAGWLYVRSRSESPQARAWNALSVQREQTVVARLLPSLQAFVRRQTRSELSLTYYPTVGGLAENYIPVVGDLILGGRRSVGQCSVDFFYRGWEPEPSSAELTLFLEPSMRDQIKDPEFRDLMASTPAKGFFRGRLADTEWTSHYDEKGRLAVSLGVTYPSRWMEQIPEYDRGFVDEIQGPIARRVIRFLGRQVLAKDLWLPALAPPVYNPPANIWSDPLGHATGYIRTADGELFKLEIETSMPVGRPRDATLQVTLRPAEDGPGVKPDTEKIVRPAFIPRLGHTYPGDVRFDPVSSGQYAFRMSCPLNAPIDEMKFDQLTPLE